MTSIIIDIGEIATIQFKAESEDTESLLRRGSLSLDALLATNEMNDFADLFRSFLDITEETHPQHNWLGLLLPQQDEELAMATYFVCRTYLGFKNEDINISIGELAELSAQFMQNHTAIKVIASATTESFFTHYLPRDPEMTVTCFKDAVEQFEEDGFDIDDMEEKILDVITSIDDECAAPQDNSFKTAIGLAMVAIPTIVLNSQFSDVIFVDLDLVLTTIKLNQQEQDVSHLDLQELFNQSINAFYTEAIHQSMNHVELHQNQLINIWYEGFTQTKLQYQGKEHCLNLPLNQEMNEMRVKVDRLNECEHCLNSYLWDSIDTIKESIEEINHLYTHSKTSKALEVGRLLHYIASWYRFLKPIQFTRALCTQELTLNVDDMLKELTELAGERTEE